MADYRPISCSFYDILEASATLKRMVRIRFIMNGSEHELTGIIRNLYIENRAEYLRLDSGISIRLDHLVSVDGQFLADSC